jgi:hypothetical protein
METSKEREVAALQEQEDVKTCAQAGVLMSYHRSTINPDNCLR